MIPNSAGWAESVVGWVREANDCHNPSGPKGGQFCSKSGVAHISDEDYDTLKKFNTFPHHFERELEHAKRDPVWFKDHIKQVRKYLAQDEAKAKAKQELERARATRGFEVTDLGDESGLGSEPQVGDSFIAFRLGKSTGGATLGGRNAGNAEGVALHLTNIEDVEKPGSATGSGDTIHAFRVTLTKPVGEYSPTSSDRGTAYKQVGRQHNANVIWYNFSADGTGAKVEKIGSVPLETVRDHLQRVAGSRSFDWVGSDAGAKGIRAAFEAMLRGKK